MLYSSKQITENRCLERYLDVSLEIMRLINTLWEPLQRLAPLFNLNTKADFLVNPFDVISHLRNPSLRSSRSVLNAWKQRPMAPVNV